MPRYSRPTQCDRGREQRGDQETAARPLRADVQAVRYQILGDVFVLIGIGAAACGSNELFGWPATLIWLGSLVALLGIKLA